jgi:T5orf172 domain/Ribbon-helix-helix protein, copG family
LGVISKGSRTGRVSGTAYRGKELRHQEAVDHVETRHSSTTLRKAQRSGGEKEDMKQVYVMRRADGAVKIGISADPSSRRKAVSSAVRQTVSHLASTHPMKNAREIELIAHKILADKHEYGEWFWVTVDEAKSAVEMAVDIFEGRLDDVTGHVSFFPKRDPDLPCSAIRRNIHLPKPQILALALLAQERGVSVPYLIREAVDEYLEKHKAEIPE